MDCRMMVCAVWHTVIGRVSVKSSLPKTVWPHTERHVTA